MTTEQSIESAGNRVTTDPEGCEMSQKSLEEQAAALLLRSASLSVSDIMELLDLGDQEFRALAERNVAVARLLEARRTGSLPDTSERQNRMRICLTCEEEFLPYAGTRYCSDICARLSLQQSRGRVKSQMPQR